MKDRHPFSVDPLAPMTRHGEVVAGDGSLIYGIPCNADSVLKIAAWWLRDAWGSSSMQEGVPSGFFGMG